MVLLLPPSAFVVAVIAGHPLRAINPDAIESFAIFSHFSGSMCGLIVNAAFFRMSLFIGFLIEEAAVKLLKVLIVRDEDNGTR